MLKTKSTKFQDAIKAQNSNLKADLAAISKSPLADQTSDAFVQMMDTFNDDDMEQGMYADLAFASLADWLVDHGVDEDIALETSVEAQQRAYAQLFVDVFSKMNPEAEEYWDKFMNSNPNIIQVSYTLDILCQKLLDQTYDQKLREIILKTLDAYQTTIEKSEDQVDRLISLNNQQEELIKKLLEEGKGEAVNNLLTLMK